MSIESNKALVVAHLDKFNAGDLDGCVALVAEDMVNHAAVPEAQGRRGARGIVGKLHAEFPDIHLAIEDVIAEGDHVACRLTMTRAHGRTKAVHMFRIAGGAIVERWVFEERTAQFRG